MKFLYIATALIGAVTVQAAKLPSGAPCKPDGSMGVCASGLCIKTPDQPQGKCK
ncbi:hypothetical protein ASPVEDRAFT_89117 [Aspergillus versicolor CBS 583.65]|uniref:CBM1 domain-containing protein n=1 Tax=Aspergillus versicolor CBS 583.65 TaxID=1036611 RepID=A0A1L9Q2E9_ASPVE|nr:uncharacterized protein ASPVEDRAFT_89117 [Aspergillus versicolor CBS 583.65]OJJ07886.1 hypothetical protein ASPVEDRAFT_89117 [Aspergillus versicolor CBS 583.65]